MNHFTISPIGNNNYLFEGDILEAKFITETDISSVSLVDIKNGPKLAIGKDFLGYGEIDCISLLRTNPNLPLLVKIHTNTRG